MFLYRILQGLNSGYKPLKWATLTVYFDFYAGLNPILALNHPVQ